MPLKKIILKEAFWPEGKRYFAYSTAWKALESENLQRVYRTFVRHPVGKPFTFNNVIFTKIPLNHNDHE